MSEKVVSLARFRDLRSTEKNEELAYHARILTMNKLELLEEMIRFQEERSGKEELTVSMMVRGKLLFGALERAAETQELRMLTRSYRRHLEFELEEYSRRQE